MIALEEIREKILHAVPDATVEILSNPGPSQQHSLLISPDHAIDVAKFLRDDSELRMDYCSNVTGVDWPPRPEKPAATPPSGESDQTPSTQDPDPGFLEVVYHLFSMSHKHGPIILRLRTGNRSDNVTLPSLTPIWRSAEFQEREVFDLYGISFEGHPDLRRLLMWDEFEGHPMRKDYVPPEDDEDREIFEPARRNPES